jgi:hypothetical protein
MGNSCGCCGSDEGAKKDSALDQYIKTHHMWKYPHKCPKMEKSQQLLHKIDFEKSDRTLKSQVQNEILDDVARKQDL